MPDDRYHDDNQPTENDPPGEPEVPASVAFMEMMRQAAARNPAPEPKSTAADQLFAPYMPHKASAPAARVATPAPVNAAEAQQHDAAMEEQRIRRVKRRRARRRQRTVSVLGGIVRSFIVMIIAAGLMATIFTWWTPAQFLNNNVRQELSIAQATSQITLVPTSMPTPNWLRRIGIVSGHRGPQVPPDPGAVCPDGLTEASINFEVAQQVVVNLRGRGYSVDLLDEFDPRLDDYQAAALVSIHTNTCQNFGEVVSGYLIAAAAARVAAGRDDTILVDCVAQYYAVAVGLERRAGVTIDMTDYHTFREIHPLTPAAIIELGFMLADRAVLTEKQTEMAQGITNGILCFLEPSQQPATQPAVTETPTG